MNISKYALIVSLAFQSFAHSESIRTEIDTSSGAKIILLQKINPHYFKTMPEIAKEKDYSKGIVDFAWSSTAVYLVPSVPVLDQGQQGTCVTFAATAAIDASLGIGDDISQQCSLELDDALGSSLWNGAQYASEVIDPLVKYGAVRNGNCGSHSYPDPAATITSEAYKALVDPSIQVSKIQYVHHEPATIEDVKAAIDAHHYVAIGFGLLNNGSAQSVQGFDVVVNGSTKSGGLWACKQPSSKKNFCGTAEAGHEVVIIGYDDAQNLVKIQNSWNVEAGDSGYFYMTYEFLSAMQFDFTEIWSN